MHVYIHMNIYIYIYIHIYIHTHAHHFPRQWLPPPALRRWFQNKFSKVRSIFIVYSKPKILKSQLTPKYTICVLFHKQLSVASRGTQRFRDSWRDSCPSTSRYKFSKVCYIVIVYTYIGSDLTFENFPASRDTWRVRDS